MKCDSFTTRGTQCTRKATDVDNDVAYCKQHFDTRHSKTNVKSIEPWIAQGLAEPLPSNGRRILQKLRTKLKRGPAKGDGAGCIYIYSLKHERHHRYWKIGRTVQDIDERMAQWQDVHGKDVTVVLERVWDLKQGQKWTESVIHLYLAYCRMYRYQIESRYHSVWALDPDLVIEDGQQLQFNESPKLLVATHKHTEWFHEEWSFMMKIIEPIVERNQK